MSGSFSRSMRYLEGDDSRRTMASLIVGATLLGLWAIWFFFSRVALHEVTDAARLEVDRAVHPLQSPVSGRVVSRRLQLGQEVELGEVLVELEAQEQQVELDRARHNLGGLSSQRDALFKEISAQRQSGDERRQAGRAAIEEAQARLKEADAAARFAEEQVARLTRLHASGLVARAELERAQSDSEQRQWARESLRRAMARLQSERRRETSDHQARVDRLEGELAGLDREIAATAESIKRLDYELEKRKLRAPVAGWLAEVADVAIGSVIHEGEKLGTVIPGGELKITAYFNPAVAVGRVRPGQPARLRLKGFPWTQYGSVSATVRHVASEPREQRIRVELSVSPNASSSILLQHGLPGAVEVEVERISPATLVLRAAGKLLAAPRVSLAGTGFLEERRGEPLPNSARGQVFPL